MSFSVTDPKSLNINFFEAIDKQWMLITAGNNEKFNTMTASWGGTGILWNKNVVFTFIRESRYTLGFVDDNDYFTLSFFGGNMKKELAFCGSHSGRDTDKIKETGLIPVFDENAPYFEQAELVLVCKKLYRQKLTEDSFIDKSLIDAQYSNNDWNYAFEGENVKILKKD